MIREEAIEEVKNYDNYPNGLSKECRDYIIKTLELETVPREHYEHEFFLRKELDFKVARLEKQIAEQEPCEDCVSRQSVVDFLENHAKDFDDIKVRMAFRAASSLVENVDNVPPVTPTRKKGKWIRVDHNKVKCSKCEITHLIAQYPHGAIGFCPNCGAEMR